MRRLAASTRTIRATLAPPTATRARIPRGRRPQCLYAEHGIRFAAHPSPSALPRRADAASMKLSSTPINASRRSSAPPEPWATPEHYERIRRCLRGRPLIAGADLRRRVATAPGNTSRILSQVDCRHPLNRARQTAPLRNSHRDKAEVGVDALAARVVSVRGTQSQPSADSNRTPSATALEERQGAGDVRSAALVAVQLPSRLSASAERVPGSAV